MGQSANLGTKGELGFFVCLFLNTNYYRNILIFNSVINKVLDALTKVNFFVSNANFRFI